MKRNDFFQASKLVIRSRAVCTDIAMKAFKAGCTNFCAGYTTLDLQFAKQA
ncbi:MAG: hypothetical protein ACXVB4_15550 [Pseudobdellovibrionaceae bacterium]